MSYRPAWLLVHTMNTAFRALRIAPRIGPLLALLIVVTTPRLAAAQSGESIVVGAVHEAGGRPIADAQVTARNRATGAQWTLRSSSAGQFAFVQLPLGGPYDVTASRIGFASLTHRNLTLALGRRLTLDFTLRAASSTLAPVNITTMATSTGGNRLIDAAQLAAVPTPGRNFTDLAALAPTSGPQLSLLGQRWTGTDIRIDGVQARNMLRAGELGAGPFTLSLEAIREFDVRTVDFDVTQGRQGGGAIHTATKSGTNEWTSTVFSYFRGSDLAAPSDFQARSREQREFSNWQWGGSVAGPLVQNRAHLLMAFDRQDANEPLFSGLVQTPADERAIGIARDSLIRALRILSQTYGLDTSRAQIGRLDRRPVSNALFTRLDWALTPEHLLTVSNTFNLWSSPLSGGVDQPVTLFEARANYESTEQLTTARLRSTFASGWQNDLTLALSSSQRSLTPNSTLPRGFVRIQSQLADGSAGDARVQFGGNRLAPDDSRERGLQLINQSTIQRGRVLWSLGTDNALSSLTTYIAESQGGLFEFQSLSDLEARRAFRYSRTVPLTERQATTHQKVLEMGAFAQAEWRPSARQSVTAGLRWDGTAFLNAPERNASLEQMLGQRLDRAPRDWSKWQPRLQYTWDRDGDGREVFRIGGGRFAAQPVYYLQHNQLLNDGRRIADITLTGSAVPTPDFARYRADASTIPRVPTTLAVPPYVNIVDPSFRTPSVWKTSASYQRPVGAHLTVAATVLASRTTGNYMYVDRNLRDAPAFRLSAEQERPVFVPAASIDAAGRTLNTNALADPRLGRVLALTSVGESTSRAAIMEAQWRLPRAAQIDVSYTNNRSRDNTTFGCCLARTATTFTAVPGDPRDLSTTWGPSDLNFRHKVVIAGTLPTVWGIRLGGRYVGSNGRPFSAVVNGDINGDESTSNDLAFVFDPDDPATPLSVAESMRRVLSNPRNVASGYLRAHLGRLATRNGATAPWIERIDVRASREIRTGRGQSIEIALDVFNVANLVNAQWGAEYQLPMGISNQNPVVQRVPLLNVVAFNQATRQYTYTVNENFGVLQKAGNPYQLQLSARYRLLR